MILLSDLAGLWQLWALFVLGGAIGYVLVRRALGAFRSQRSTPLLLLTGGLLVLTIGVPLAWTSAYLVSEDMLMCTYAASSAAVAGAALLLVSTQVRSG